MTTDFSNAIYGFKLQHIKFRIFSTEKNTHSINQLLFTIVTIGIVKFAQNQ